MEGNIINSWASENEKEKETDNPVRVISYLNQKF